MSLTTWKYGEHVGIPTYKVIVSKRSQQYIGPDPEFDMSIADFHRDYSPYNIINENVAFFPELGAVMVKPLMVNRSNYFEGAILPEGREYTTEHPGTGKQESIQEIERRVFVPIPTMHQQMQEDKSSFVDQGTADFKRPSDIPRADYNGPEFKNIVSSPPPGAKKTINWLWQSSAADNVEWFMIQKYGNFTNQSFWIDVHKERTVTMNAEDNESYSRYHRYGREVRAYFAVRIGWYQSNKDSSKYADTDDVRNSGSLNHHGPYDIVFPINGTPFIWDHGGRKEDGTPDPEEKTHKGSLFNSNGFIASEMAEWTLTDEKKYFRLEFYVVKNQLLIRSKELGTEAWIFPQNTLTNISKETSKVYENFFVPASKVCIMGRGFKHRMSFNPLEFDIYDKGRRRQGTDGLLTTRPIQQRVDFPNGSTNMMRAGWHDLYSYKKKGNITPRFNNFFAIPFASNSADEIGELRECDFGMDIVPIRYEGLSGSYTSMMIAASDNPYDRYSFGPKEGIVWTQLRQPNSKDRAKQSGTVLKDYGFDVKNKHGEAIVMETVILEIGLNCKKPTIGKNVAGTSERFASPIIWRVRGKHENPIPPAQDITDISSLILDMSYNTVASDLQTVRSTFDINVLIPKSEHLGRGNEYGNLGSNINTRQKLLNLLQNGVTEIKVYLGWEGGNVFDPAMSATDPYGNTWSANPTLANSNQMPYLPGGQGWEFDDTKVLIFTGLMTAGPLKQTYAQDTLTLNCYDKIQMLEDYPIINSPFYDGMNVDDVFYHVCTLSGLPRNLFLVQSKSAQTNCLGAGYTFTDPKWKFDVNSSLYEAIKRVAKQFWHVIRPNPDGRIVLTDLNATSTRGRGGDGYDRHAVLEDLQTSAPSFTFYVDGSKTNNPFLRPYNDFTINKVFADQFTNLEIMSFDKQVGAIFIDNLAFDIDSIEDPSSADFIGYRKPIRQTETAFGDREHVANYRDRMSKHIFQASYQVNFTIFGRPMIRPFDIIQIVFPASDDRSHYTTRTPISDDMTYLNFRVMSVSGNVNRFAEDFRGKYTTIITAVHK